MRWRFVAAVLIAILPPQARASETVTYSYDALGRLVATSVSGGPNNGMSTSIQLDKADNRTNYSLALATPCVLTAGSDLEGSEYSVHPTLTTSGSCSGVSFSYTVQVLTGSGTYYDSVYSTIGNTTYLNVSALPRSPYDPLVLKINWVIYSGTATFGRQYSIVTFYNDGCWC